MRCDVLVELKKEDLNTGRRSIFEPQWHLERAKPRDVMSFRIFPSKIGESWAYALVGIECPGGTPQSEWATELRKSRSSGVFLVSEALLSSQV
ncbi:MAG: hypothetical protein HRU19_14695 [Pseudobacteriovorax sp.]|nr:hypothetical protein [Pseudobacteriovorax sp.]